MLDLNHTKLFVTFGLWWIPILTIFSEQERLFEGSQKELKTLSTVKQRQ